MTRVDLQSRLISYILRKTALITMHNRIRYGWDAPVPGIRLTLPPSVLTKRYHALQNNHIRLPPWRSGQVDGSDWDQSLRPFEKSFKFDACRKHFVEGTPWTDTDVISMGLKRIEKQTKYDNCFNEADLIARYARLDDLWEKTQRAGTLPDAISQNATLRDSILVHMTRDGTLVFGNFGFHRLSIAKLAKIDKVTVLLGVTHTKAVTSGAAAATIAKYRHQ